MNINSQYKDYPLVSIVVPAYNHESYIANCIHSILEQDYPDMDLIVINDGSTDGTDQRIKEIHAKKPLRFRYISKQNEGLMKTLNLGLKLAQGKYFCELASDDMLLPESIRKRVDFLEINSDIDVVFADAYLLDGDTKTNIRLGNGKKRYNSKEHSVRDLMEGKARILFPSGMFRKAILDKLGGFDEDFRYYEDIAMEYQLAIHAKIGYLDEPIMYYRRHASNVSLISRFRVRKEKILALKKISHVTDLALDKLIRKTSFREYVKYFKAIIKKTLHASK